MDRKNSITKIEGNKLTMLHEETFEITLDSLMADVEHLKKNIEVNNTKNIEIQGDVELLQAMIDEAREKGAKTEKDLDAEIAALVQAPISEVPVVDGEIVTE